ncbi:pH-responsive protein 1 [Ceratocystis lukuohia]
MTSLKLSILLGLVTSAAAISTLEQYGNKIYDQEGNQFFMKGIAYQLRPNDPLIDSEQCARDAKLMKELGANTLRVYHVDETADHDGCMKVFEEAGIYLTIDLDDFESYILPYDTFWNETQYDSYAKTMDAFIMYDNLLGFYVGNEIIAKSDQSHAAPYIKAAIRDMKAYRDSRGYRKALIGYSATDIVELRPMLQDYLTCGGNDDEIADFFGINAYEWCTPNTYTGSGYDRLQEMAENFPVPIFFSETGCNVGSNREWEDMDAIYSDPMVNDWSGAIAYEWIEEKNNYGIVSYGPPADQDTPITGDIYDGFTRKGTPTPVQPDFDNLKSRWATNTPIGTPRSEYDSSSVSTPPINNHLTTTLSKMVFAWKAAGISYNRYLAVAARALRRSLKEDKRIVAERRAESDLKFSAWTNGKAGEAKAVSTSATSA